VHVDRLGEEVPIKLDYITLLAAIASLLLYVVDEVHRVYKASLAVSSQVITGDVPVL
jgi:hypothetical protein